MTMSEILAAVEALPDNERTMLTNYLAFGVKPVKPVPVRIERGDYRVVLPDGTAIEGYVDEVIFEIDADVRWNSVEPSPHAPKLRVYQDGDIQRETVIWAVEINDEIIPVTLPDDWEVVWY